MLKPDYGFHERQLSNVFVLTTAAVAGTLMTFDTTVNTLGVGDQPYGNAVAGSVSVAGDRELGCLYYDVTTNGPSFFNVVSGVLDLTTAVNGPITIWHYAPGAILHTDQFLASGTGSLTVGAGSGNTALGTQLGIKSGQFVVASAFTAGTAGSVPRAKVIGNGIVNNIECVRVQIL